MQNQNDPLSSQLHADNHFFTPAITPAGFTHTQTHTEKTLFKPKQRKEQISYPELT